MRWRRAWGRGVARALALGLVGGAPAAAPAAAQLARVTTSPDAARLIVVPFQRADGDSVLSVTVADGIRERLRIARAADFNVVPKGIMCENLQGSGFPCDVPLDGTINRQLARFMNTKVLVEGMIFPYLADSLLVIARLAELTGAAPQSASASTVVSRTRSGNSTGTDLANRLFEAYRAFPQIRSCQQYRDASDYARALEAANRALRAFAQSAGAFVCIAQVRRAQGAPSDSILAPLRQAHNADSLNSIVLRQLARIYEERNDTTALLHELDHILRVDIGDNDLRIRTARLYVVRDQPDSAIAVLDRALDRNPNQIDLLNAKSIALAAARRWTDAAATLAQVAELDTTRIDSIFGVRITTYYQQALDTTNLIRWNRVLGEHLPDQPQYLYQLATLLRTRSDTVGAIASIRQFLTRLPNDPRGNIVYATYLLDVGQADSALARAATAGNADSMLRPSASQVYFVVGARTLQAQDYARATELLRQAKAWASGRILVNVSFFLGIAELQLAVAADTDAQQNRNCEAARRSEELLTASEQDIIAGVAYDRERANTLLSQAIPAYKQRAQAMQRNFCR